MANDVIQNCKRKNAKIFQDTFKKCLVEAVHLVKNDAIKSNIERIFDVWAERNVYDKDFIVKLNKALYGSSGKQQEHVDETPPKNDASPLETANETATEESNGTNQCSKHDLEQIIGEFQPKKLCEAISAFQTETSETSIYKANVEATRLLDINFDHIKQYRGKKNHYYISMGIL